MYCVYCHTNKINGKRYIGQTKFQDNLYARWRDGKGYHKSRFGYAIKKYGWDNFEHIILARNLTKEQANDLEKYYISKFDTTNTNKGYNVSLGGDGASYNMPEITKQKISNTLKGRHHSEETKQKIKQSNLGKKRSIETCKRIGLSKQGKPSWNKGITFSEEYKQIHYADKFKPLDNTTKTKISETLKGCRRMNNGTINTLVKSCDIEKYLELGYTFGYLRKETNYA